MSSFFNLNNKKFQILYIVVKTSTILQKNI